ncbi:MULTISPECIES: hypothetical protein [Coprobacillaceae]|uniref:hypothetical protein n=1 Tax=Coprobacillaceae TaxID=2810280 RepID=UPI000E4A2C52|nr:MULTISPECIES: hypothetical protein [Coprobacillaceae]RHM63140.1 hypothetical protein DWZ53_01500 [Coprobacillus sp. AF33-1AC]RHS93211.1 hypothetical protein DW911_07080 [Erysipelatoclostridium sp. AM42-17]
MIKKLSRILVIVFCLMISFGCASNKVSDNEKEVRETGVDKRGIVYKNKDIWLYCVHFTDEKVNSYLLKYNSQTFDKTYGFTLSDGDTVNVKIIKSKKEIVNQAVRVIVDEKKDYNFQNLKASDKVDKDLKENYRFVITHNDKTADFKLKKQEK